MDNINEDEKYLLQILDYIDGVLTKEETKDFEKRMSANDTLKNDYEQMKKTIHSLKNEGRKEISEIISKLGDNKKETNHTNNKTITMNSKKSNPIFKIAAIGILLIGALLIFKNQGQSFDASKYIAENSTKEVSATSDYLRVIAQKNASSRSGVPEDTTTVIFKGERIPNLTFLEMEKLRRDTLMQGMKLFEKSEWRDAATKLSHYVTTFENPKEDNLLALFYLAKAKFNAAEYGTAVNDYNKFINGKFNDQKLMQLAEWDRALCYMKIDESKVKNYLEEMSLNNGHKFQDEAKGLIQYYE